MTWKEKHTRIPPRTQALESRTSLPTCPLPLLWKEETIPNGQKQQPQNGHGLTTVRGTRSKMIPRVVLKCIHTCLKMDLPGGPGVKNPPANAGDTGSIPGPGSSHIPRGQLSPCITTTEPAHDSYGSPHA